MGGAGGKHQNNSVDWVLTIVASLVSLSTLVTFEQFSAGQENFGILTGIPAKLHEIWLSSHFDIA